MRSLIKIYYLKMLKKYNKNSFVEKCPDCGKYTLDEDGFCSNCYYNEDNQDEDLGCTGHGDISWSDADPGL